MNQLVITRMLDTFGFDPEFADDGQAELDAVIATRPDLVLMDIPMPGMNGMETTRAIRAYEAASGTTPCLIVALTVDAMSGDRDDCLTAGMDDFLSKPVTLSDLETMLERWLPETPIVLPLASSSS